MRKDINAWKVVSMLAGIPFLIGAAFHFYGLWVGIPALVVLGGLWIGIISVVGDPTK